MKMNYKMMLAVLLSSQALAGQVLAHGSHTHNGPVEQKPIDGKVDGFDPNTKGGLPNIEQRPVDGKVDGFDPNTKGGIPNIEQKPIDGKMDGFDPGTKGGVSPSP